MPLGSSPSRQIVHLDMDAFYASVELLRYPDLKGKAVVIGGGRRHQPVERVDPVTGVATRIYSSLGGYQGRGVITTATYEARALGVGSAMGLMKAAQRAPDAILLVTTAPTAPFRGGTSVAPRRDRGIDRSTSI
jgi:DNA polymerase-4